VNETGVTRFEGESWFALFAPAATPAIAVGTLRAALAEVLRDREFAERIERDGGRVLAIAPAEQRKFLEDEVERWSALVARYGVSIE
jgi:tripartite-type tricarboxylate transporter receptor subunit TctC